ncbi:DUF6082 family protein [Streptomyces seoulensis]|uniref:DUF6082 family protein n=1 Tax=Streptomyces seoulensis TaxID=73044 RepID=UPI001FCC33AB|nr:DUF6082 family protein [Streptomyces seoulensis]BDH07152.1 spore coat protein [Streptomyces seoulensis]
MKPSSGLVLAALGVGAHLLQRERHQRQHHEALLARIQLDWLTSLITHPELAEQWKPEGLSAAEYVELLNANRMLCAISLRHRLGFAGADALRFFADEFMSREPGRRYWHRFGALREREAQSSHDPYGLRFNRAMNVAYAAHTETAHQDA